jgi:hypothetical protein
MSRHASSEEFSARYTQEVVDFVDAQLKARKSECEVVEALRPHGFGKREARRVVHRRANELGIGLHHAAPPATNGGGFLTLLLVGCALVMIDVAIKVGWEHITGAPVRNMPIVSGSFGTGLSAQPGSRTSAHQASTKTAVHTTKIAARPFRFK